MGFEAAKDFAQTMRALTYTTMITVENGFWIVTAKARAPSHAACIDKP
jgi:hypothetical protein